MDNFVDFNSSDNEFNLKLDMVTYNDNDITIHIDDPKTEVINDFCYSIDILMEDYQIGLEYEEEQDATSALNSIKRLDKNTSFDTGDLLSHTKKVKVKEMFNNIKFQKPIEPKEKNMIKSISDKYVKIGPHYLYL